MVNKDRDFRYLERYQEGHYGEVWNELVQLGSDVFEEPLVAEALAVARAMMRRVRTNLETLMVRLLQYGFVFGYDVRLQAQLARSFTSAHDRRTYGEMNDWVHEQPLVFWPAKQQEEENALTQRFFEQDASFAQFYGSDLLEEERRQTVQKRGSMEVLQQIVGPVPLTVQAWFEEIEQVNFYGYHPQWGQFIPSALRKRFSRQNESASYFMSHCDPFQISVPNERKMKRLEEEYRADKTCSFEFAPDHDFKDFYGGTSTPYRFVLPQASMDAIMPHPYSSGSLTFVEYIRLSLTWAGFPGMSQWTDVPRDDLEALTHDLLPF